MRRVLLVSAFLLAVCGLLATQQAAAYFEATPDLQLAAAQSAYVARATISPVDDRYQPCGYHYKATVIESIKGSSTAFEFFSAGRLSSIHPNSEYLIFASQVDREGVRVFMRNMLLSMLTNAQIRRIGCYTLLDYYVPSEYEAVLPLERRNDAEEVRIPHWRGPPDKPVIRFCNLPGHSRADGRISWKQLRASIATLLRSPRNPC